MKKRYKKYLIYWLLSLLLILVLMYLCCAFIVSDINAINWSVRARGDYLFISFFQMQIPTATILVIAHNSKEN